MLLLRVELDLVLHLQPLLILLDIFLTLILTWQHEHRDSDVRRVIRIHHSRVTRRSCLEHSPLRASQVNDLPTPAVANNTPLLDSRVLVLNLFHDLRHTFYGLGRRGLRPEELAELLALLFCVWWVPTDIGRLALEKVGHEDPVLVRLVGVRKDVGALQCLGPEAENIVDDEDGLGC